MDPVLTYHFKEKTRLHHIACLVYIGSIMVLFLSLILVCSLGYLLNCFGLYYLCFNEVAPFISGGFAHNLTFLVMSVIVLPPKQVNVISSKDDVYTAYDFSKDDVEAVVRDVISIVHSNQDPTSN